jgi:hypothetical protein
VHTRIFTGSRRLTAARVVAATLFTAAIVMVGTATSAVAAGSEAIVIEGPGLDVPVEIDLQTVNQFELAVLLGARFNSRAEDNIELDRVAPTRDLGPKWTVTWIAGGPEGRSREDRSTRQEAYPHAAGGPLAHTPTGQGLVDGNVGWYRAPPELNETLRSFGVPIDHHDYSYRTVPVLPILGLTFIGVVLIALWRVARSRDHQTTQ